MDSRPTDGGCFEAAIWRIIPRIQADLTKVRALHPSTPGLQARVYKQWAAIFNSDAVLTSALLDRLLHHAETARIDGKSYRSKDQIEI